MRAQDNRRLRGSETHKETPMTAYTAGHNHRSQYPSYRRSCKTAPRSVRTLGVNCRKSDGCVLCGRESGIAASATGMPITRHPR